LNALGVFVVESNPERRTALVRILEQNYSLETFELGLTFLQKFDGHMVSCILLDLGLPDISGLDVLNQLRIHEPFPTVIAMSPSTDAESALAAVQAGALEFLVGPLDESDVRAKVHGALRYDYQRREKFAALKSLRDRYGSLTKRQKQVMSLVIKGERSRSIAAILNVTTKTVEAHRIKIMRTMDASSVADLVQMIHLIEKESEFHV